MDLGRLVQLLGSDDESSRGEAAPADHNGDLLEAILEVSLVLMVSDSGPRSDPGELQNCSCELGLVVVCVAAAPITSQVRTYAKIGKAVQ